ncbi:19847_t:CDS:2, partial [Cetraspora pellucida]
MNLPIPKVYNSADKLFQTVQRYAISQGFALVKKRTRKNQRGELKNMDICCDKGGVYNSSSGPDEETRCRQGSFRLINCPYELRAARRNNEWHLEVYNNEHNHIFDNDISGHPIARQLSEQQLETVTAMTAAGSRPREIVSTLRHNDTSTLVINRDVYNAREWLRQQNLAGRSPIQALIDELKEGNFTYKYECNDTGSITYLFFMHNESIALTRQYSSVVLMDWEEKIDYQWALDHFARLFNDVPKPGVIVTDRKTALMNALKITFPNSVNLLCVWHISKNILKNCKPQFPRETENTKSNEWKSFLSKWNEIVQSVTEKEFEEKWSAFCITYTNKSRIIAYLEDTWLPLKEKFVAAWTNLYFHLGTTVTSRVEGAHSTFKAYLQVSTGDLYWVVSNQKKEFDAMVASERIHIPLFALNNPLYMNIKGKVTTFALRKINEQHQKANRAT